MIRLLLCVLMLLFSGRIVNADIFGEGIVIIEEEDGSPSFAPYKLKVANATLTDNGDNTASLAGGSVSDTVYGAGWNGDTTVAPSKNAVYDKIETLGGGHDAVTLGADADVLLGLSTQQLTLDSQAANVIFAGPGSGAAADPTFRALVDDDVPNTITLDNLTQITTKSHTSLSDIGTNAHSVIDTFIASKAAASGLASLDVSSLVVQNPANATATPTASKIPIADGSGLLDGWITLGAAVDISSETNLAGDTEIVLTGDALSIASTITRDTEWDTEAEVQTAWGGANIIVATEIDTSAEVAAILGDETGTGVAVFGTSPIFTTSIALPQGTAPTVDAAGEVGVDTTDDQLIYYGGAKRVIPYEHTRCIVIENLAAADDNYPCGMFNDAVTITGIGVHCDGTCTTAADIDLSDRAANAMTHGAPTVSTTTGATTFTAVTAANGLTAGEGLEFSVANAVSPETDKYTICYTYTYDAQ